jgi:putative ABC transport system permease protein
MFFNYLTTALRFFKKNLIFALNNLTGLTIGITAFILIVLYIQDQVSYDRKAPNSDRLYRLVGLQEPSGLEKQHVAITSAVFALYLSDNVPQVEDVFRIMFTQDNVVEIEEKTFRESEMYFSEGNILTHMGFRILKAEDPQNILTLPNQAAISRQSAERFFNTSDVIGEVFKVGNFNYKITGVFENEDINTHLKPEILLSFSTVENIYTWLALPGNNTLVTYMLLKDKGDQSQVEKVINNWYEEFLDENPQMMKNTFYLQPFSDIFLRSGHIKFQMYTSQGNVTNIYALSVVAILIILIACINYINLSTANSSRRFKEVGLRKLMGAMPIHLALQFIGESMIITLAAIIMALGAVELVLPYYNAILETQLHIDLSGNRLFNMGLIGLLLFVGIVSGFYPAMFLSKIEVGAVLRGGAKSGKPRTSILRQVLVIFQFAIASAMILSIIIFISQIRHMENKNLGYNQENIMVLYNQQPENHQQIKGFRDILTNFPEIVSAGIASGYSGVAGRQSTISTADSIPLRLMVRYGYVDPDFFPTMQIKVVEGRNFSYDYATDANHTIIINKAAQRALGWENPLGMRFLNEDNPEIDFYTVIGVIDDYHYFSLRNPIEPAVYIWRPGEMAVISLRYQTDNPKALMAKVEQEYKAYFPGSHFHAVFLNNTISRLYNNEKNMLRVFTGFALLCIIISCLGLLGLTAFTVNQRRKEIGIRKILGGSIIQINALLLSGFLKWVLLAALISFPVTYFLMSRWLENYAYRIDIAFSHFAITLGIILTIATSTILVLSTGASAQNPINSIKYE